MSTRAYTFTATGAWLAPSRVFKGEVVIWGGGASGGGGGAGSTVRAGGGGGGAGYLARVPVALSPGTSYTGTIGAGGTAPGIATAGNDGGASYFGVTAG